MAIKERKQITGTEAQINGYAGHNGVLAYATDTKHLHVLSGTAGTTTKLANVSDISGKADKTYVDTELAKKQAKGDYVPKTGNRGALAGYSTSATGTTVNATSGDSLYASSNVTVANGATGQTWTKVVKLSAGTVTLGTNWSWVGGEAPELKYPCLLVCHWNQDKGIAGIVAGVA